MEAKSIVTIETTIRENESRQVTSPTIKTIAAKAIAAAATPKGDYGTTSESYRHASIGQCNWFFNWVESTIRVSLIMTSRQYWVFGKVKYLSFNEKIRCRRFATIVYRFSDQTIVQGLKQAARENISGGAASKVWIFKYLTVIRRHISFFFRFAKSKIGLKNRKLLIKFYYHGTFGRYQFLLI